MLCLWRLASCFLFFFKDPATTEIYTLSLHDALPISGRGGERRAPRGAVAILGLQPVVRESQQRSEEHTSELQSRVDLVCRLLLEKKKSNAPACTKLSITKPNTCGLSRATLSISSRSC